MHHIDYGLSVFKAAVFDAYAADEAFDLATVMGRLVQEKKLAGYEVLERFYEMGSPTGLAELEALLADPK
jgi:NDP-sugar pyrophosphorylase family protein